MVQPPPHCHSTRAEFPIIASLGSFAARYPQALSIRNDETLSARTPRTAQRRTVPATSRDAARRSGNTTACPGATSPRHAQSIPVRNPRQPHTAVRNPARRTVPVQPPAVADNSERAHRHRPTGASLRLPSRLHADSVSPPFESPAFQFPAKPSRFPESTTGHSRTFRCGPSYRRSRPHAGRRHMHRWQFTTFDRSIHQFTPCALRCLKKLRNPEKHPGFRILGRK
jgi:hypothetical protein